jgi:alpha-L-rhamnosidase
MSKLTPFDLRCEHLAAPQGLNTRHPRFTWALRGPGRNRSQSAYRIVVDRDRDAVARGEGRLWDSGEVASRDTLLIPYAGHALPSGETVHWAVQVWDEARVASDLSEPAAVHVGLRDQSDWTGKWLARALVPPGGRSPPQDTVYDNPYWARPADYYRREIDLNKPVSRATLYATALGVYELRLNGAMVGDQTLAPGWTDYHTRVEYQSYDVAHLLRAGANAIGAIVGEGWYCGRVSYDAKRAGSHYGVRPAFLCQLHVEFADGTSEIFVTDGEWRTSNEAIVYSDLLLGEKYDARLEQPGWDRPGFDDAQWWRAEVTQPLPQAPRIEAARGQPVRGTVRLDATFLHRAKSGAMIFDLGQNIAGHCRLAIDAPRDTELKLRHAEALAEDGELYVANLRWALQTDTYISKGGRQVFEPRFTVHGFRYIEVEAPASFGPDQIGLTGVAVHTDMPLAGTFACGSTMVNQLVSNIVWTHRDNFLSVPTDCPQRDERMGWLADAQIFLGTAAYNMDVAAFFTKWRLDIADAQTEDGAFTDVAPSRVYTRFQPQPPRGAPGWGDGGVIIPWRIYQRYGDREMLLQHYDGMVRWMDHIERANPDFIRENALYSNWGDWLCVGAQSPKALVATAYWAHLADIMTKAAALLGRRQDEARFTALFRDIRRAFQESFVQPDGIIASDTQTVYLLALEFGLVLPAQRDAAVRHLLRAIERADGHLQTGILGLRHLCPVLSDHGAAEQAYDLLLKETYPSWGFSIRNGATTIWERWDGWTPERGFQSVNMNSLNHYALGAIGEWLYARVAGIDFDEVNPAFRRIRMRPLPSEKLGWCKAAYRSHLGEIRSEWTCGPDGAEWKATIPPNCTASVTIPAGFATIMLDGRPLREVVVDVAASADGATFELGSGEYVFKLAR